VNDLRFAFRILVKDRAFAAVALLTLALGIGANTAIFSVVHGVVLRSLPYAEPERLVMLWERSPRRGLEQVRASGPNFIDWRDHNRVFADMAFWTAWTGSRDSNLVGADGVEKVGTAHVSSSLFRLLGAKPRLGRTFLPEEDQREGNRAAVLGYDLWLRRFGADPDAVGRTLTLDSYGRRDYTIVGVMGPGFRFPAGCEIWLPAGWTGVRLEERRSGHWYEVIARLKDGVTLEAARSEMNAIQARIEAEHPGLVMGSEVAVVPLLEQTVGPKLRAALLVLWGIVACVLSIACANVANLLLARAAARQREIGIRLALGASRWRVTRQLVAESVMLAILGGMLGVLVAYWILGVLAPLGSGHIPRVEQVRIDGRALAFTLVVSSLTGLLFGFGPAWQLSKPDLNEPLKEGGRGAGPGGNALRSLLVVSEIALSLILLIGTGLMTRSFVELSRIDRGFRPDHLVTAQLDFSVSGFTTWVRPTSTRPQVTLEALLARMQNLPGVRSVAAVSRLPVDIGSAFLQTFAIENRPQAAAEPRTANFQGITPDYFRTLGVPLLRGRSFTEQDAFEAPQVAIVSQATAKRYFPNEDPIGKRLSLVGPPWSEIVGVVADIKDLSVSAETAPQVYLPYWQWPMQSPALVLRTAVDSASIAAALRAEIKALNKNLPVPGIRTMDEILADSVAAPRFHTLLAASFAVTALALAAVGIYGVMACAVTQRTREIGIRMALGAQSGDVLRLVVASGMRLALAGVAIGLGGAAALTRVMSTLLYQVKATDPPTFAAAAAALVLVALAACWVPARRATRVDPVVALRYE
jgi:putative ABC transport system permease protein